MREYKICPSIYGANIGNYKEEVEALEKAKVDGIHFDVMDGHFVQHMCFGSTQLAQFEKMTDLPLDVHLMVEKPERLLDEFLEAGGDVYYIHPESTTRLLACLQKIKAAGKKAAVVLNPATPEESIKYVLDEVDYILQMTINPGETNAFYPPILKKLRVLNEMIGDRNIDLVVDGGINDKNIKEVAEAGANMFVSGGYVFKGDIEENIQKLRDQLALVKK